MSQPENLAKARLVEIKLDDGSEVGAGNDLDVQFNPETLTLNYTVQNSGTGQPAGSATQQAGQGTTKLTLDLWFDVTARLKDGTFEPSGNVMELTRKVKYFIKPAERTSDGQTRLVTPGLRFVWGSFLFDGVMDSLNERLDFFSEQGKPLRAQLSVGLTKQDIQFGINPQGGPAGSENQPGTSPFRQANQGSTAQQEAAAAGKGANWKGMAAANGIENPRQLAPGLPLNTTAGRKAPAPGSKSAGSVRAGLAKAATGGAGISPAVGGGAALEGIRKKTGLQFP